ncbi:unnamed protein product, partial [Clonostachys rosea f. rosea IK726]
MSSKRDAAQEASSPQAEVVLHRCSPHLGCLARDASLRARTSSSPPNAVIELSSPRRSSSSDSLKTEQSDPQDWFNHSNWNPTAAFDSNITDIDPPYFLKESDSPSSEKTYCYNEYQLAPPITPIAHSSSASDYRSVIDDLSFEILQLREELKHYKQTGPDVLYKDRLLEVRFHELPKEKRRELESILRDFATGLDGSATSSSRRRKTPPFPSPDHSEFRIKPKHATSSPGSSPLPADSAYASMSTAAKSLSLLDMSSTKSSKRKREKCLREIPVCLYPKSSEGRKIQRRGGSEGTKSSSDNSSRDSQQSPTADNNDNSNKRRRGKTSREMCDEFHPGSSSKDAHKFDPQLCDPFESFRYKALSVEQDSSSRHTSLDETSRSFAPVEGCNSGKCEGGLNGSEQLTRGTQYYEGAIIYYSGAPFCIDLSRDPSDVLPTTHALRSSRDKNGYQQLSAFTRSPRRIASGSLTDRGQVLRQKSSATDINNDEFPVLINDDSEEISDIELDLVWTDNQQGVEHQALEPCGLGGVYPEDHFVVSVAAKRPK